MSIACTSAAISAALKAAAAGAIFSLAPGPCPALLDIQNIAAPGVTIDASATTFSAEIYFLHVSGITWERGISTGAALGAMVVSYSTGFTIINFSCVGPGTACIAVDHSSNIAILGGQVTQQHQDGVDLAGDTNAVVSSFSCANPAPTPTAHPDCIQGWAIAATATTPAYLLAHVWIVRNTLVAGNSAATASQGFDVFNNNGPAASALDVEDIHIEDNTATTWMTCAAAYAVPSAIVRGNVCTTPPGSARPTTVDIVGSAGVLTPNTIDGITR